MDHGSLRPRVLATWAGLWPWLKRGALWSEPRGWLVQGSPEPDLWAHLGCSVHPSESHSVVSDFFVTPMDYTAHGILQARILEWVAFPFSRDLSNPGIQSGSPALQAYSLPAEPLGKPSVDSAVGLSRAWKVQLWEPRRVQTLPLRGWPLHCVWATTPFPLPLGFINSRCR